MLTLVFSRRRAVFRQQLQHPAVQEGELQSGGSPPSRGADAESPEPRRAEAAVMKRPDSQSDRFLTGTKWIRFGPRLCIHVLPAAVRGQGSRVSLSRIEAKHLKTEPL